MLPTAKCFDPLDLARLKINLGLIPIDPHGPYAEEDQQAGRDEDTVLQPAIDQGVVAASRPDAGKRGRGIEQQDSDQRSVQPWHERAASAAALDLRRDREEVAQGPAPTHAFNVGHAPRM